VLPGDVLTIIGLVINGTGLIFVATQVVLARRQLVHLQKVTEAEVMRSKRQATIEFYMATVQQIGEWRAVLPDDWNKTAINDFVKRAYDSTDSEKLHHLARYLGFFEALAATVLANIYDLAVLDSIAGSRIINIAENYRPFFERRRIEVGADSAYRKLEWLGNRLRDLRNSTHDHVVPADKNK
jgi:hypothetical protein